MVLRKGTSELVSHAGSEIVRVLIGKDQMPYNFHKALLTKHCPFFTRRLESSFSKRIINEVALEEENTDEFDHFFVWIYHRVVETDTKIPFGAVYVLADKFGMEAFKNAIIDAAMGYCEHNPAPLKDVIPLVGHNLLSSPLSFIFIHTITFDIAESHGNHYSCGAQLKTFSNLLGDTEVMERFLLLLDKTTHDKERGELKSLSEYGQCNFHEHQETTQCDNSVKLELELEWW